MKNIAVQTSLRSMVLKYKKEVPLTDYENELIKKYTQLNELTATANTELKQLVKNFEFMQSHLTPLREELAAIKSMRHEVVETMKAFENLSDMDQIKSRPEVSRRMDVFNAKYESYEKKMDAHCKRCGSVYDELKQVHEKLDEVEELCEEVEKFTGQLFQNYETYSLSISAWDEDWQDYAEDFDRINKEYRELWRRWKKFVEEHNAFLKEHSDYVTMVSSFAEKEEPAQVQKKPDEEVGEQYKELAERFENDLKNDSRSYFDLDDWNLLIDYYYHVEDKEKVNLALERAEVQHPDNASLMLRRSLVYINAMNFQKALELLAAAEAKGPPFHPALYQYRGIVYEKMQMPEQAIALYKKAIAASHQDTINVCRQSYQGIARLYKAQKKEEDAINALAECVKLKQHDQWIIHELSYLYASKGRPAEAETLLTDFLDKNPRFIECWLALGNIYRDLKKLNQAHGVFDKMLEMEPNNSVAHFSKGEIFRQQEQYAEALNSYNDAIKYNSSEPVFYLCAATTLEELNQKEEAAIYYRLALEVNPDFTPAQQALKRLKG